MGLIFSLFSAAYYIPRLYFASSPATISVKGPLEPSKEIQHVSLRTFVAARCPSLLQEFRPAWWLFSGHLQTAYSVLGDFSQLDKIEYDRTLLQTSDGGTLGLDFAPPKSVRTLGESTPIVVILHGLTGGSHESYVRAILSPTCTPVEEGGLGYRGVVVNFRGCAGVPITSPQFYSAGYTDDIRVAILYISKRYPRAPLIGVGFSLGANVLTRYLAEEGNHCRLMAGCVLACPWHITKNQEQLDTKWLHRNVYGKAMVRNLQRLVKRHASSICKFSDHPLAQAVPEVLALETSSCSAFDSRLTCIGGGSSPPFPFPNVYDYYEWASSHDVLRNIRVPFLAINSEDDPIVQVLPVDVSRNPWVAFAVTKKGGHLGWFEINQNRKVRRWIVRPVLEWLRAVGEELVVDDRQVMPVCEIDGFLKEAGRDNIGCKEIRAGEHVVGVEGEGGLLAGL